MSNALALLRRFFWKDRFLHFLLTGAGGVIFNLSTTWVFTQFVFGLSHYYYAYMLGVLVNFIFNFTVHTMVTFQTKRGHLRRLIVFTAYSALYVFVLSFLVSHITPIVGVQYYLFVIAGLIMALSIINFFVFKLSVFRE